MVDPQASRMQTAKKTLSGCGGNDGNTNELITVTWNTKRETLTLKVLTHSKGLSGDGPDRGEMTVMVICDIPVLVVKHQFKKGEIKIAERLWLKSVARVRCQDFVMDYESDF